MFGADGALGSPVDLTRGLARLPTGHCIRRGLFIPGQGMSGAPAVCGAWLSGHHRLPSWQLKMLPDFLRGRGSGVPLTRRAGDREGGVVLRESSLGPELSPVAVKVKGRCACFHCVQPSGSTRRTLMKHFGSQCRGLNTPG